MPRGNPSPHTLRKDGLQRSGLINTYLFASFFRIVFAGSAYSFRLRALMQEGRGRPSAAAPGESG